MNTATIWAAGLLTGAEDLPGPEDYDPGWGLFATVVFLIVAVVVLARSFRKQLRKTDEHFLEPGEKGEKGENGSGHGGVIGDSDSAGPDDRRE